MDPLTRGMPTSRTPLPPIPELCVDRRILVVEDDLDLVAVFRHAVMRASPGIHLEWAMDLPNAIAHLNRLDFALVVTDFLLDCRGNGLLICDWCEYFRPNTPVALMSALLPGTALPPRFPPERFLQKPFTPAQLREFIGRVLPAGANDG